MLLGCRASQTGCQRQYGVAKHRTAVQQALLRPTAAFSDNTSPQRGAAKRQSLWCTASRLASTFPTSSSCIHSCHSSNSNSRMGRGSGVQTRFRANDSNGEGQQYDYGVVVIGGGSGGVRTARTAADLGSRVALIELPMAFISSAEKGGIGGTCVLRGCVPKKLMLYASEFATEMQAAKGFGWIEAGATLEWQTFLEAKREELHRLNKAYTDNLKKSGVEIIQGRGVVTGHHEVEVDGRKITTRNIVIATGGQSSHIPIPGAEHAITSDKVLELDSIPKVVTLIGGGYIGMEFAGMFARLGSEVHVIARQQLPLAPRFDGEVCRFFNEQVTTQAGIYMHMCSNPTEIVKESDGTLTVKMEPANKDKDGSGSSSSEIRGNQQVVLAVGRAAKTKGLGLEEVGVEMGPKGSLKVDKYSRSNIPSIWGVGDVTSRIALTPVAIMEGQALGQTLATGELVEPCYEDVPSACFSWPFVATVVSGPSSELPKSCP
eukprot:GHUV01002322.1.p1 GENE.GHUV01002322.1~~GHUV01002322.1.p1  ORF type:complete len:489 (+),score=103.23 GHUV01002322.1:186-1652(+)